MDILDSGQLDRLEQIKDGEPPEKKIKTYVQMDSNKTYNLRSSKKLKTYVQRDPNNTYNLRSSKKLKTNVQTDSNKIYVQRDSNKLYVLRNSKKPMKTYVQGESKKIKTCVQRDSKPSNSTVETEDTDARATQNRQDPKQRRFRLVKHVDVRHKQDVMTCSITGSTLITPDTMALADYYNNSVKIIDLTSGTITACLKLDNKPWDLTCLNPNTLVVTCWDTLVFLKHSNKRPYSPIKVDAPSRESSVGGVSSLTCEDSKQLELTKTVKMESGCMGITCRRDKLYITVVSEVASVKILNIDGDVLQTIDHDTQGRALFVAPRYITLSNDGTTMYVSDFRRDTVTSLDMGGNVRHTYTHTNLDSPAGLAVDGDGDIFVGGARSHNIHLVSPTSPSYVHTVLEVEDRIKLPSSVLYYIADSTLYVGCWRANQMAVYKSE